MTTERTKRFLALVGILALVLLVPLALSGCESLFDSLLEDEDVGDAYEQNDSFANAYSVVRDQSYDAHIGEDDADFFSFTTGHGSATYDAVEISATNTGPDLRIGIAVYDPDGELIGRTTTNTPGADLSYTLRDLQSDRAYVVRFSGTWGVGGWAVDSYGDYDSQGPYTFRIRNLDENDDFAGNHSIDDAHSITTGVVREGVLVSNNEADYFAFTPTSETMQLAVTNAGADLKVGVALYFPNRERAGKSNAETAGANLTINLNEMNTSETYYLRFSGTDGWSGWTVGGYGDHSSRGPYTFVLSDS